MAIDWQSSLYDPIYSSIGVSAKIKNEDFGEVSLTVIDKTSGITVGDEFQGASTIPAVDVRLYELEDFDVPLELLPLSELHLNDKIWIVKSYVLKPSPAGRLQGEARLFLADEGVT